MSRKSMKRASRKDQKLGDINYQNSSCLRPYLHDFMPKSFSALKTGPGF